MSFLDATEVIKKSLETAPLKGALQADTHMQDLHKLLVQAYPDREETLSIAGQVGIFKADIEIHPKNRDTWWSVLEEAARGSEDRLLRRLVCKVLEDPTVADFRARSSPCWMYPNRSFANLPPRPE